MNPMRPVSCLALCVLLAACGPSSGAAPSSTGVGSSELTTPVAPSSGMLLRQAPTDLGCDSIGWEGEPYRTLTFHVDPDAIEQVWAESDTGAVLTTYWSNGFHAGTQDERLVRDPLGEVFVSDGEVVDVPEAANLRIHDYLVCLRPDKLYVLTAERG